MHVSSNASSPKREHEGLLSHVLLERGDAPGANLAVTWVRVEPGSRQRPHSHDPQQVYVIVEGEGRMQVGEETRDVTRGDLVFIPPGAEHGIVNTGDGALVYVSSATPAFDITALYDSGELRG
jgi:quercetin dioxygenase-like cupin family protein